jgi:phosphoglycolate phosphatase-like HAD superfamily hydrolase
MKAAIFDFDGVLVGTREENYKCHQEKYDGLTPEIHMDLFDGNVHEIRNGLLKTDVLKEKTDEHIHSILNKQILKTNTLSGDASTMLEKLKGQGLLLFIVSSNSGESIKNFLQKSSDLKWFDEILGHQISSGKKERIQFVFEKYDLESHECVFITDTVGDMRIANKLGVPTIGVNFGIHSKERLEVHNPHTVVSNFNDLYSAISKLNKKFAITDSNFIQSTVLNPPSMPSH